MRHSFDPATPDSSKPRWARGSRNNRLQSILFPSSRISQQWTPEEEEEEDWLHQRKKRERQTDWKDIGAEIAVKFGIQRTIQALQGRLIVIRARAPTTGQPSNATMGAMDYYTARSLAGTRSCRFCVRFH